MAIIFTLVALLTVLLILACALSFSLAWYETVRVAPADDQRRTSRFAARLVLGECCALFATLLLRPLGWLPPRYRPGRPGRQPVIILHGLFQNRSCLLLLQWRLHAAGFGPVVSINTPSWYPLEQLADRLARAVTRLRAVTGAPKVSLVGHSMGGILARSYLQRPGVAAQVAACVTLGSPHHGSKLAPYAITRMGRALGLDSTLLERLNDQPLPPGVACSAIYSRHDNIIVPAEGARLDGATNIEVTGVGHTSLLFSSQAAAAVVAALHRRDQDQGAGGGQVHGRCQSPVPSNQPLAREEQ